MRILVACEESATVREAFRAKGHEVWSCDLLPSRIPGPHWQGDVLPLLQGWQPVSFQAECDPEGSGWCQVRDCDPSECQCIGPTQDGMEYRTIKKVLFGRPKDNPNWDMLLAFPPCTYLCSSGLHRNKDNPERTKKTEDALRFVEKLLKAPIDRICLENSVGCISSRIRKPDQIIHPWQFGHPESKQTCLWLKGLPLLKPTKVLKPKKFQANGRPQWDNMTPSGQNKLGPSETRSMQRSKTYDGIARAMAEQYSLFVCDPQEYKRRFGYASEQ